MRFERKVLAPTRYHDIWKLRAKRGEIEAMNADAIVLALLAIADLAFLKYLRYRRWEAMQKERVAHCLAYAVHRELVEMEMAIAAAEPPVLAQAS